MASPPASTAKSAQLEGPGSETRRLVQATTAARAGLAVAI
jgi:hypothetical protein